MDFVLRMILTLLYVAWLPAMLLGRLLGRDPLQLKKPAGKSFWLVRELTSTPASYASENSLNEGRPTPREGDESGARVGTSPPVLVKVLRSLGGRMSSGPSRSRALRLRLQWYS